jgi:hypothetical protein
MLGITVETRPDRCELCRFGHIEHRYVPPPYGTVVSPYGGYKCETTDVIVCKRMPPVANADGRGASPVVSKGDYCGEFKEKD